MRQMAFGIGIFLASAAAVSAETDDVLNEAFRQALETARISLEAAPRIGTDIERIGVATLEKDRGNVSALFKSILTQTRFEIVLTDDEDWTPLLDEFARQMRRQDIIVEDTIRELRIQGVDAVVFGTIERTEVSTEPDNGSIRHTATVRLLLNCASLGPTNPGSLLWSEQVTGTAETHRPMTTQEMLAAWVAEYALALAVVGGLAVIVMLGMAYRRAGTPR